MLTVGPRLRLERMQRGISQIDLARRTSIAQANLSNIENGKQDITVSTLLQICVALDVKPSIVLDPPVREASNPRYTRARLENMAAAVVGNHPPLSKKDREIVDLLRKNMLPRRGRRISAKEASMNWTNLKRQLSDNEIETLRQRVQDALQRQPHEEKYR